MKAGSLWLLPLLLPSAALAQPGVSDDSQARIVITGAGLPLPPGTPAYGSVQIERDRLLNSASGRIESILTDVAGFQQFRRSDSRSANPSAQGASLRALGGNASSRTLVLLDGVPMADPFFGYIPFSALVPERLSAVRVTRGGGVGAFGAGAVAGTIELASATRDQLPTLAASALYGSRDATELSASLTPSLGAGFLSLSGRWDRGDGFQTTPRDQRVPATVPAAYDGWSANLRAVVPVGGTDELQFRTTLFHDERTLRFRGANSLSEGQDASIRYASHGRWQVDALAYVQARNFANIVISSNPPFRKTLDQRSTPSTGIGGKIELRPPVGGGHLLRVGMDSRFAAGDMFEDAYSAATGLVTARRHAGGRQRTIGMFVEDDWTLGNLVLTGGIRADRWTISDGFFRVAGSPANSRDFKDRAGWEVSARAGALLHLNDKVALRGAAYTGFRLPTLNELYRPFVVFPVTTEANPALSPEQLKGVEAGIDLMPVRSVTLSATAFYNRLDDAIANVTMGTNLRRRDNVDAIIAKGVELTASARHGAMSLYASYAYSHSAVRAPGDLFDGLSPAQTPRHSASATFAWQRQQGPGLSATLRYVSAQYEDDLHVDRLPGFLTIDAVARLPLGHGLQLVARGENLFDEDVLTRRVSSSTAVSEDMGAPRTLWIGFTLSR